MKIDQRDASVYPVIAKHIQRNREQIASEWHRVQFCKEMHDQFPNPYAEDAQPDDVMQGHLLPMLDLLAQWYRTGNTVFRDLYLAERRRFAPHRDGLDTLTRYFALVTPKQEAALTAGLDSEWAAAVRALTELGQSGTHQRLRALVIGDCLMSDVQSFLGPMGLQTGMEFDFRYYYFSALMGVSLLEESVRNTIKAGVDFIAASYLSYEGIPPYRLLLESADNGDAQQVAELIDAIAGLISKHLNEIRELTEAPILLHNAGGLPLSRWRRLLPILPPLSQGRRFALGLLNARIASIARQAENCVLIDETSVVESVGFRECSRPLLPPSISKNSQMHPEVFSHLLSHRYMDVIKDMALLKKTKLLLVDFDNTLWEGVMADGPIEHFAERQKLLKRLSDQGILLAAVSKNDPANIRWEEMHLSTEDFVSLKISWGMKTDAIRQIATELNLGRDSFVFLDDNAAERELVHGEFPEVVCLDSTDTRTWQTLERLFQMPNTRLTEEAKRRTLMYKEQAKRDAEINEQSSDYPALMSRLQLRASLGRAQTKDLDRVVELFQRTNQFNTTTIRYSRGEIESFLSSKTAPDGIGPDVLISKLSDKFGDLGVVCAVILNRTADEWVIENFVMSCRAMGFGMEQLILAHILALNPDLPTIGRFVPSSRNEPASALFKSCGFQETSSGTWRAEKGHQLVRPEWIAVE